MLLRSADHSAGASANGDKYGSRHTIQLRQRIRSKLPGICQTVVRRSRRLNRSWSIACGIRQSKRIKQKQHISWFIFSILSWKTTFIWFQLYQFTSLPSFSTHAGVCCWGRWCEACRSWCRHSEYPLSWEAAHASNLGSVATLRLPRWTRRRACHWRLTAGRHSNLKYTNIKSTNFIFYTMLCEKRFCNTFNIH